MSDEHRTTEVEAVAAIRLALLGAADDHAAVAVISAILDDVPASDAADTASVRMFIEAARGVV